MDFEPTDRTSEGQDSAPQKSAKKPAIRINSAKVTRLDRQELAQQKPESKFSQWRAHRARRESTPEPTEVQTPVAEVATKRVRQHSGFMSQRFKRWAIVLGSLLLCALVFIGVVFYSPLLAVREIKVQGTSLLDQTNIETKLSELEGVPLTRISEDQVEELIGSSNLLRGVKVEAHPPHELVVTVNERVPVAVVADGSSFMMVDADGVKLGTVASAEAAGLPLVDGGLEILGTEQYKTISSVLVALPASLLSQVKEAKADSASTISLIMAEDVTVVWGTAEDSELKAKVLSTLMESVGSETSVTTYDVSSPKVPTVK